MTKNIFYSNDDCNELRTKIKNGMSNLKMDGCDDTISKHEVIFSGNHNINHLHGCTIESMLENNH